MTDKFRASCPSCGVGELIEDLPGIWCGNRSCRFRTEVCQGCNGVRDAHAAAAVLRAPCDCSRNPGPGRYGAKEVLDILEQLRTSEVDDAFDD